MLLVRRSLSSWGDFLRTCVEYLVKEAVTSWSKSVPDCFEGTESLLFGLLVSLVIAVALAIRALIRSKYGLRGFRFRLPGLGLGSSFLGFLQFLVCFHTCLP